MTEEQVFLVQNSFHKLVSCSHKLSECFLARLYSTAPELKTLFDTTPGKQDGTPLVDCLRPVIGVLGEPERLVPTAQKLAMRHKEMGIRPNDYPFVGEAMIWTLKHCTGNDLEADLEEAWAEAFLFVASTMINSSEPAQGA